jgi:hypothetical protein
LDCHALYSLVKVLSCSRPLPAEKRFSHCSVRGASRPTTFCFFTQYGPAHRRAANCTVRCA